MADVYLISESKIKSSGIIPDNMDANYLNGAVKYAQEIYLQQALGSVLYRKMIMLVEQNTIGQAEDYKILLDEYIQPYLLQRVLCDVQVVIFAKLRNAGVVTSQDQQTTQMTRSDVDYLRNHYEHQATFYLKRMTDWLCANATKIPEYRKAESTADIRSSHNNVKCGIYLG